MNLKTIADRAGVSTATVSNVINGVHNKVSKETIERVNKVIEELNYSPNATARSLASKESRIIGLIVPNTGNDMNFGSDPYTTYAIALLEQIVRREGYYLMIRSVVRSKEITNLANTWNVDGMVILGAFEEDVMEIERVLGHRPTVYTDTYVKGTPIANVGIDDYKGGFLSASYLLEMGHRKIALVSPDVESPGVINERYRGFCDALGERGLTLTSEDIFVTETSSEAGSEAGKAIARSGRGYTAVAAMSDTLALGVNKGLQECGLGVPDDVSVIGFDDLRVNRYMTPGLTTISQNMEEKFRLVGEHLFQMIRNKEKYAVNERLDVEVVERETVRRI